MRRKTETKMKGVLRAGEGPRPCRRQKISPPGEGRRARHPVKRVRHPVKEAGHAREVEHSVKAAGRPVKVSGHGQEVEHPVKSVGVNDGLVEML